MSVPYSVLAQRAADTALYASEAETEADRAEKIATEARAEANRAARVATNARAAMDAASVKT